MLIELCFGQTIEAHEIWMTYCGPDGRPNSITDFAAADHRLKEVLAESGPDVENAIRRCLYCAFAPRSTNFKDKELQTALYSEVIEPLEDTARGLLEDPEEAG